MVGETTIEKKVSWLGDNIINVDLLLKVLEGKIKDKRKRGRPRNNTIMHACMHRHRGAEVKSGCRKEELRTGRW